MFAKPDENIEHLKLTAGSVVADFGAGTGHFTFALAKRLRELAAVSSEGEDSQEGIAYTGVSSAKVYAVDVQKELLDRLAKEAEEQGFGDIVEIMWGDLDEVGGSNLADRCCDAVLVANTFFQSEDKNKFAMETYRVLKQGGQLLVVDWTDSHGHLGPTPEMVVTAANAEPYFTEVGYRKVEDYNAGEHHWGTLYTK